MWFDYSIHRVNRRHARRAPPCDSAPVLFADVWFAPNAGAARLARSRRSPTCVVAATTRASSRAARSADDGTPPAGRAYNSAFACDNTLSHTCFVSCCLKLCPPLRSSVRPLPASRIPLAPLAYVLSDVTPAPSLLISASLIDDAPPSPR
ncbi:hypothetical protein DO73_4340 [Burkholderia pseudomallei]|nr:hypothetical protein DO73_4340 [Burkholderia pseudomallei]